MQQIGDFPARNKMAATFYPTVMWTQRKAFLFLRVKLQSVEEPDFKFSEAEMTFKAVGVGHNGKQLYAFQVTFLEPVEVEGVRFTYSDKELQFWIPKKEEGMWPRLQVSHQKPHWLQVDFDHYVDDGDSEDGGEVQEGEETNVPANPEQQKTLAELEKLIDEAKKEVATAKSRLAVARAFYLFVYNTVQTLAYGYILVQLLYLMTMGRSAMAHDAYRLTGQTMKRAQLLSFIEIFHAASGMVKGSVFSTVVQVLGRNLLLFMVIDEVEEVQGELVIFTLFFAWSLTEVCRYPYYATNALNLNVKLLTWLRYTIWIAMYPLGGVSEAGSTWKALPYVMKEGIYSIALPNAMNFSFDFGMYLKLHLILIPLGVGMNMMYLAGQRKKKLGKAKAD